MGVDECPQLGMIRWGMEGILAIHPDADYQMEDETPRD